MIRRVLFICAIVPTVLSGCVTTGGDTAPLRAYSGPARPAARVATFKCGFGVVLKAIDGNAQFRGAPLNCAYRLLPGRHRFRVQFMSRYASPGMSAHSRMDYIITLKFSGGRTYSLNAFLKKDRKAPMPWRVELSDSSRKNLIRVTTVHEAPRHGS